MSEIQFIERDGRREYAVVPIDLFERMAKVFGDIDDVALFDAAKVADDGYRVPGEVLHAILGGTHPVKVWREYRGLTQDALATKVGISKAYLCQIETGKREGAIKTLRSIASTLDVSLDDLSINALDQENKTPRRIFTPS